MPIWIHFTFFVTGEWREWRQQESEWILSGLNSCFFIVNPRSFYCPKVGTKAAMGYETQCCQHKVSAVTLFTTQCRSKHAPTAVLKSADNMFLHIRPSQQLQCDFRHTPLRCTGEWVWIEARLILIPIISSWFSSVIGYNRVRSSLWS